LAQSFVAVDSPHGPPAGKVNVFDVVDRLRDEVTHMVVVQHWWSLHKVRRFPRTQRP
jgi:uncharacterized ferritin-like protein (DUF455 family)